MVQMKAARGRDSAQLFDLLVPRRRAIRAAINPQRAGIQVDGSGTDAPDTVRLNTVPALSAPPADVVP